MTVPAAQTAGALAVEGDLRVAVIGDVGGHVTELRHELVRLGVPDDGAGPLPDDLVVCQVGDLVHKGPSSDDVVALVDGHLSRQPERWVQLVGNHEAHYLRRPVFKWKEPVSRTSAGALRRWWADGLMRAALALRVGEEQLLISHAGITEPYWRRDLSGAAGAGEAARRLNMLFSHDADQFHRPGRLLGQRVDLRAGPLWADAAHELLPSWLDRPLPFSQVHGHSSLVDWETLESRTSAEVRHLTEIDPQSKHEETRLTGGRIVGVDPGHGSRARTPWRAWVVGPVRP